MTEKQKGLLAIFLVALAWGILPIFPRYLNASFSLYQQIYLRVGIAFIFSLLLFSRSFTKKTLRIITRKDIALIGIRALFYWVVGAGLMTWSLLSAKVSNVMFIQALPTTAILGIFFFKERLGMQRFLFIALSFFGVLLVSLKDQFSLASWGPGELFSLISAFAFSFAIIGRKWHSPKVSDRLISTAILGSAFVFSLFFSLIRNEKFLVWNGDWKLIGILIFSGIIISGMNLLLNYAYKRVEAVVATPILTLETVLSVLFAWMLFSETPSLRELFGGVCIITAALGMQMLEFKRNS